MVAIYQIDHIHWRWRVYNMLLGYQRLDSDEVGDYKRCRLGRWYYGKGFEKFKDHKIFKELEEPHLQLHKAAKEATIAYEMVIEGQQRKPLNLWIDIQKRFTICWMR